MREYFARLADDYRRAAFSLAGGDPRLSGEIERALSHARTYERSYPLPSLFMRLALARLKMLAWSAPAAFLAGFAIGIIRILVMLNGN